MLVNKLSDYVSVKGRCDYSFLNVLIYVHLKIEESIMDVSSSGWAVVQYIYCAEPCELFTEKSNVCS